MTTMVRGVPAMMVVIALLVGALAAPSAAQAPLRIRIGWVVAPAQLTPLLFQKQEILKHHGKSYVVEPVHFRGSTPQITALAAGELEIAALAYSSFPLAVHNAKLDLRVVAGNAEEDQRELPLGHFLAPPFLQPEQLKKCNGRCGIGDPKHRMQEFHVRLAPFIAIYARFVDGP